MQFGAVRSGIRSGVALATAVALIAALWLVVRPTFTVPNPLAGQTTVTEHPPVLRALNDLAEFHAAEGQYQVIVDVERSHGILPGWVAGQHVRMLVQGEVDAFVDFSAIGDGAIQWSPSGTTVTITLPHAELDAPRVVHEGTQVLSQQRGAADRIGSVFTDTSMDEVELLSMSVDDLTRAAEGSGLRDKAEHNTAAMLAELLGSVGIDRVYVRWTDPASSPDEVLRELIAQKRPRGF